ncbi:interleukin-2 receptor subunit alpha isoform X2 [Trachypithecus francoisi]|uniref:interleukin-2 receptor subunit alpha isoform X2 n=1 Tax=Trachypithecus francoisi TaxID=54180 RepID=UPI00141ADC24|nr:interleukin-2 receptor subunit alpha isoform X2 [Trachypithecus francoisi]
MDPYLLMWGLLTFITVPGCQAELCDDDPPKITHATFKAVAYKEGTMLNCECKRGFRRIKSGSPYMLCTGNSGHSSWDNQCQCTSSAAQNTTKQVTPQPEEQKERKTTEMQSQMQLADQASLPGHCREPPLWENEATERIYHFVVGQMVYYQCVQGYRALHRGPAESICKMTHGKTRWTQPQLICTSETEPSQFPGEEEPQASPDGLAESETSRLITTTDFRIQTEVAATMETFIFTTEYQVAGGRIEEQSRKPKEQELLGKKLRTDNRSHEAQAKSKVLNARPGDIPCARLGFGSSEVTSQDTGQRQLCLYANSVPSESERYPLLNSNFVIEEKGQNH